MKITLILKTFCDQKPLRQSLPEHINLLMKSDISMLSENPKSSFSVTIGFYRKIFEHKFISLFDCLKAQKNSKIAEKIENS
jgi:hypothetical protein